MSHLRHVHLIVGIAGLIAFVLTGQYMHWELNHLRGMPEGFRLFTRSCHIYLMWSSALNVLLGCHLVRPERGSLRLMQFVSSLAIVVGPFLLGASFFFEPYSQSLLHPIARSAILLGFGGVVAHAIISLLSNTIGHGRELGT
jgi:hypothetical protein